MPSLLETLLLKKKGLLPATEPEAFPASPVPIPRSVASLAAFPAPNRWMPCEAERAEGLIPQTFPASALLSILAALQPSELSYFLDEEFLILDWLRPFTDDMPDPPCVIPPALLTTAVHAISCSTGIPANKIAWSYITRLTNSK